MVGIKNLIVLFLVVSGNITFGQIISSGKIVFERKTNLEKKFKDSPMGGRMMKDLQNVKSKIDVFEMYFNDTCSIFKPKISDDPDPLVWATTHNTIYQNEIRQNRMIVLNIMGQEIFISDSIQHRNWKVTESTRKIAGYNCKKAIWQKDDSTRIYAWFSVEIVPSIGPEGFCGLPGAILGLATEDGGIIYFAKSVEVIPTKTEDYITNPKKKDVYTLKEFKAKMLSEYANNPWGKRMFTDLFKWL